MPWGVTRILDRIKQHPEPFEPCYNPCPDASMKCSRLPGAMMAVDQAKNNWLMLAPIRHARGHAR
jgi:hypothetical protein